MTEGKNPQFERIKQVFGTNEISVVAGKTLHIYFEYLKERLDCPCMITGICKPLIEDRRYQAKVLVSNAAPNNHNTGKLRILVLLKVVSCN